MIDQYGLYGEGQGPRSVLEEAFEGVVIGKVTKKKKAAAQRELRIQAWSRGSD